jgi:hypothetical protein
VSRAYLRVAPEMFERKLEQGYTPAQIGAFIAVLCLADSQPRRGWFRDETVLRALLTPPFARYLPFLMQQKDLVRHGKSLYVDGWTEWQDGDFTVAERMKRLRERQKSTEDVTTITPPVVTEVTPPNVTPRQTDSVRGGGVSVSDYQAYDGTSSGSTVGRARPRKAAEPNADETNPRTNGADPHPPVDPIEAYAALAGDPSTPDQQRQAARQALERHAPQRLAEVDAQLAAAGGNGGVTGRRPRGRSG